MTIEIRHGSYEDFQSDNINSLGKGVCPDFEKISATFEGLPVTVEDQSYWNGGKITLPFRRSDNLRIKGASYVDQARGKLILDMNLESGVTVLVRKNPKDIRMISFRHTNRREK